MMVATKSCKRYYSFHIKSSFCARFDRTLLPTHAVTIHVVPDE